MPGGAPADRIPIVLLTGFLGTGKTTLLRALLAHPGLADTAVLINELGEVGLDHQMVFGAGGEATGDAGSGLRSALLLANGCICCTVRDDMAIALDDLFVRRAQSQLPAFSQVIIETTGLANPVPIIEALRGSPIVANQFQLAQVVCTVDAAAPLSRLEKHPESLAQVVVADTLVVTRGDLAAPVSISALEARLARLNPEARVLHAVKGAIDPAVLFVPKAALAVSAGERPARPAVPVPDSASPAHVPFQGPIRAAFHANVRTQTLRFSGPSVWGDASALILDMARTAGESLLRVKGVLRLDGHAEPMVVQFAGGRISPIEPLPGALAEGDAGYLVIITAGA